MVQSCRRSYIDKFLEHQFVTLHGAILDIGGKKTGNRGRFRIPLSVECKYLNIDPDTNPDYLCNAESISCSDGMFDGFLMVEVLEHLEKPEVVLSEAYRIIKQNGWGVITMPFMYPIHADPYDLQRWTYQKLKNELHSVGFDEVNIFPLGGPWCVIFDVIWSIYWRVDSKHIRRLFGLVLTILKPMLMGMDIFSNKYSRYITTGWAVVVKKY